MQSQRRYSAVNGIFAPQGYPQTRIVDIPDETGKRAGATQDWIPYYDSYPKIKSILPNWLKSDKDVEILSYCSSRGVEFHDPEFPHNL